MAARKAVRTLVLEVEGSPERAARLLADRFPAVACGRRGLRLPVGGGETPEAVLACCRERGIGVRASRIRLPSGAGAAHPDATAPLAAGGVGR